MNQNSSAGRTVGMDVGGTHVMAAAFDLQLHSLIENSRSRRAVDSKANADSILSVWSDALEGALSVCGRTECAGIGLAMPGPFDYDGGVCLIEGLDKYDNLYGLNIRHELKRRLELVREANLPVIFRNDAMCFALGEGMAGAARGSSRVIGITLGTGFGAGFLANGRLVEEGDGTPPGAVFYPIPFRDRMAEDTISTRGLLASYRNLGGGACTGVKELAERAPGQPLARQAFAEFGQALSEFLAPWIESFRADCLVVGGNIAKAWRLFAEPLLDGLRPRFPDLRILPSALFEDAALIGAAQLPLQLREPAPLND